MDLPVKPPLLPMLAKRVADVPAKDGFLFEPKWDGFRTLVFRDGDEVLLQSRDEKPLNRYFPELLPPLLAQLDPTLEFLRHIPPMAVIPMLILWFGIGESPKIILIILATFFPVFLNALQGIRGCDAKLVEVARVEDVVARDARGGSGAVIDAAESADCTSSEAQSALTPRLRSASAPPRHHRNDVSRP